MNYEDAKQEALRIFDRIERRALIEKSVALSVLAFVLLSSIFILGDMIRLRRAQAPAVDGKPANLAYNRAHVSADDLYSRAMTEHAKEVSALGHNVKAGTAYWVVLNENGHTVTTFIIETDDAITFPGGNTFIGNTIAESAWNAIGYSTFPGSNTFPGNTCTNFSSRFESWSD